MTLVRHRIKVEVAFTTAPLATVPTWTDITACVLADSSRPVDITYGRGDEFAAVQPASMSLTLDNSDGRFTPGRAASPYYPNVKKGRRIRVSVAPCDAAGVVSGAYVQRFDGFVDRWPQQWIGKTAKYAEAKLTATDRQARLGRSAALTSIIETEYFLDSPAWYWTLGDGSDATSAGPSAGTVALSVGQVGVGGTITFAGSTGPGTDGMSAPTFTPAGVANFKNLVASLPGGGVPAGGPVTIEAFINTTTPSRRFFESDGGGFYIGLDAGGVAFARPPAPAVAITGGGNIADGNTHHVALAVSGASAKLYVDGVLVAFSAAWSATMTVPDVAVGSTGNGWEGVVAHVAITNAQLAVARILAHAQAGLTGFVNESSNARVARLATYAGITSTALDTGVTTSMTACDTAGKGIAALLQEVATTENGLVFFNRSGVLTFHARSRRYNPVAAVTFDVSVGEVGDDLVFVEDDTGLINDATATQPGGASAHARNAASVTDHDLYALTETVLTTSANELTDRVTWKVARSSTPMQRCPSVSVDLATQPSLFASVTALDIGTVVRLNNLPAQAPATAVDLFIEGLKETISLAGWDLTFNTSPVGQSAAWVLDSPTFSQLDSTTTLAY